MKNGLTLSLLFFSFFSYAQIKLGIKGGYNLASATVDTRNIAYTKDEFAPGYNVGIVGIYGLTKDFALKTELLYASKGYGKRKYYNPGLFDRSDKTYSNYWQLQSQYLEIPVLLQYKTEGKKTRFFLDLGFYAAYWVRGVSSGSFFSNQLGEIYLKRWEISETYEFDNDYGLNRRKDNRFDLGLAGGLGFAYKLPKGEVFFEVRGDYGFLDLSSFQGSAPRTYSPQINRAIMFSLGYLITIKEAKPGKVKREQEENEEEEE